MQKFNFTTVAQISVEWGANRRLGDLLFEWFKQRRVLIVTDQGLKEAGILEPAIASLRNAGFSVTEFCDVVADPPESVVAQCVAHGRKAGADLVIGFGGGSSLDVAKLAAVLMNSDQPLSEIYGIGNVIGSRLPLIQIPTTSGTGSEVTNISILSTGAGAKMGAVADQLYADRVLLDAELTMGLPALHTAATGIDAMVHAIEAYSSRHKKNPISDMAAREALRLLSGNLLTACRDGSNQAAREAMLLGAMLAGQAFANAPVAAVHALAYPLGGRCHIPHGLSNALMLEPILRFNMKAAESLYAELAESVGAAVPSGAGKEERARAFMDKLVYLLNESGAPRRLRDAGVAEELLPQLADDAMEQTRLLDNNPVEVTNADALTLYQQAW